MDAERSDFARHVRTDVLHDVKFGKGSPNFVQAQRWFEPGHSFKGRAKDRQTRLVIRMPIFRMWQVNHLRLFRFEERAKQASSLGNLIAKPPVTASEKKDVLHFQNPGRFPGFSFANCPGLFGWQLL